MKSFYVVCGLVVVFLSSSLFAEPVFLRNTTLNYREPVQDLSNISAGNPFIVQVEGPITLDLKKELQTSGLTLLRYIPKNSFIVRAKSDAAISNLPSLKYIKSILPYLPQHRYFPIKSDESHMYTITFFNGKTALLNADNTILSDLAENPEIEFIEKFNPMVPMYIDLKPEGGTIRNDSPGDYSNLDGSETGIHLINANSVYEQLGLIGKGEVVGMADTGLDLGTMDETLHPDFQDAVKYGYNASLLSALGPNKWEDPMGHGTHVAGSIMGRGTSSRGKISGVATGAEIVVASFWAPFLNMMLVNPDFDNTFGMAFSKGTMVHSNSWGGGANPGEYDENARTFDRLAWEMPEMLLVFAAGNSGVDSDKNGKIDPGSIMSPATAKNVLSVGASENTTSTGGIQVPVSELNGADQNWGAEPISSDLISDNGNGLAMFSSRGPTSDGRIKPDLVAPGTNILSAKSHHEKASPLWGAYNEDYCWGGGTSMATPITAGAAVLVREYYKKDHRLRFVPSALVKATLINGAFDMYPGQFGTGSTQEIPTTRPNFDEGWGRVDLKYTLVLERGQHLFFDNHSGLVTGEEKEYEISLRGSTRDLRITLAYTDNPGAASAGRALVNNLDLKVMTPSGRGVFPNRLTGPDDTNNVENIDIPNPQDGTYRIRITAYNVPEGDNYGKQPFSIVATY